MWEQLKELYPNGQANRTDPCVLHKSQYEPGAIFTQYRKQYDYETNADPGQTYDPINYDAISYPLVRVNNHLLGEEQILKFVLHNDRFTPYLDLIFEDLYNTVEFADMPGLNNVITVVMMEGIPDAHKPIKLDFYTTSCKVINGVFYIQAEFKCLPLEQEQFKQEVFYWPDPGCKECGLGPRFEPTTFEFLHVIADNCKLGFSATQHTKEVEDIRYRILKRQKYKDAIKAAVACGGKDEENMFDAWIDPWTNIVLANVSWILNEPVYPDELATSVTTGIDTGQGDAEGTKVNVGMVHRILSNVSWVTGINNLMITDVKKQVDLGTGFYKGTLTDFTTVYPNGTKMPDGQEANNSLSLQQIQEEEASLPGAGEKAKEYEFHANKFAGFDMAELTPTIEQRQRHDIFFRKLRSHIYKVTLQEPNFGLERGMLTFLEWFVQNPVQKGEVMNWRQNLHENGEGDNSELGDTGDKSGLDDEYTMILDVALSGLYYIDGTDWEWDPDNGKIQQHLYLIKKNALTEYYNKENPARFKVKY